MQLMQQNNTHFPAAAKIVSGDHDGQRIDNYLAREMRGAPRRLIYRLIRSGQVRVNSRRVKPLSRLRCGDVLRVPDNISLKPPPTAAAPLDLPILHEDAALLAVNKPSGLAAHGGSGISHGVIERLRAARGDGFLELVHRLDKGTSGVLLLAKKSSALRAIHAAWRQRDIKKHYRALVFGEWRQELSVMTMPIKRVVGALGSRIASDGQPALTRTRLLRQWRGAALLAADIGTGRTHQLRVHLSAVALPIVGDDRYGDFAANRTLAAERLFLHAEELSFIHPQSGAPLSIHAPLPPDFAAMTRRLAKWTPPRAHP